MKTPYPPAPDSWFDALGELALNCAGAFPDEEGRILQQLYGLVLNAPAPSLVGGIALPDADLFGAMVSLGTTTSAALSLLGEDTGYMLSRGASGQYLASVMLPDRLEEATAGADTAALAIAGALAIALHEVLPLPSDVFDSANRSSLRLN